ncbi:MAG: FxDxF family PEP-CTERM protein, partial [Burkholderiaceae bacterium]
MYRSSLMRGVLILLAALQCSLVHAVAIDLSTGSSGFGNTPAAGAFTDTYTFSLVSSASFNGALTSAVNGSQDVDFSSISLSGPSGVVATFAAIFPDPVEALATPAAGVTLGPGLYTLSINGTNSSGRGSYGGSLAVTPLSGSVNSSGSSGTQILDLSSGSTAFFNTPAAGNFADQYLFTVTAIALLNGSLISALNGNQDVDFTSVILTGTSGPAAFTLLAPDPVEILAAPAAGFMLAPGNYVLSVLGTNSAGGGAYGGNVALTPL